MLRDWGLAIIVLVCVVRTLLHPITKKSQIMMSKMGKMAPEMEKLKKRIGDVFVLARKQLWSTFQNGDTAAETDESLREFHPT